MSFNNILRDNINAISRLKNSFPGIYPSITTTPSTELQLQNWIFFPNTHHIVTKKNAVFKSCTFEIIRLLGCISNPLEW